MSAVAVTSAPAPMVSTDDLSVFSASRLEAFCCPHRWREVYINGNREGDTAPTIVGKFVHEAVEHLVKYVQEQRAEGNSILFPGPKKKMVSAIIDEFSKAAVATADAKGIELPKTEVEEIGRMARKGIGLLEELNPDEVRSEFEFKVPLPGLEGFLRGFVDILVISGNKGRVIDLKTGRVAYDVLTDPKVQLPLYGWALEQLFPEVEEWTLELHFVRLGKVATCVYDEAAREQAKAYLAAQAGAIQDAIATNCFPALPGKQCAYCPLAENCPKATSSTKAMVETQEEFERLLGVYLATESRLARMRERLQSAVEKFGPLACGGEYLGYYEVPSLVWTDPQALVAALKKLELDPADYFTLDQTKLRKLADKQPLVLAAAESKTGRRFEHKSTPPGPLF